MNEQKRKQHEDDLLLLLASLYQSRSEQRTSWHYLEIQVAAAFRERLTAVYLEAASELAEEFDVEPASETDAAAWVESRLDEMLPGIIERAQTEFAQSD